MNKLCCAKCALTVRVTWGMHRVCVEDKWCSGAATGWRCSFKMSSAASACSCRCRWVFSEAPPLFPTSLPCQRGKEADKSLMRAPLISLGRLCSTCLLPAIILLLLRSRQKFRGLRLSALVPRTSPLCLLALSSVMAAATVSLQGLQWIRDGFFLLKVEPLVGPEVSFLTLNS